MSAGIVICNEVCEFTFDRCPHYDTEDGCKLRLQWCGNSCPIGAVSYYLGGQVEIQTAKTVWAACVDCPDKPRECGACHRDPVMARHLARRGWVVIFEEDWEMLGDRLRADAAQPALPV